jgi:hypothetical protein
VNILAKIGDLVKSHRDRLWQGLVLALVAWSAYNLGIIGARHGATPAQEATVFQPRTSIVSQTPAAAGQARSTSSGQGTADHSDPRVVASKTSTSKKYHHVWCAGYTQIKEANRLWFPTAADAEAAGYSLAGNCTK